MDRKTIERLRQQIKKRNDQLTQEPVLGEEASLFSFTDPGDAEGSIFVPSGLGSGKRHVGIGQDAFSRYDKHIQRPIWSREADDIEELRALGQSSWGLVGRSLSQAVLGQIIGGTLANVGYLFDIPAMTRQFAGTETAWGENWLSNIGNWIQKKTTEDWTPIYQTRQAQKGWAPWDRTWWASMAPSIFSTASLAIPVLGTVRGMAMIGRVLGITQRMGRLTTHAAQTIGSSLMSRHMYSTTESYELFNRLKEQYIAEGKSEREARLLAGEGASHNYKLGYTNLWKDMLTWGTVLRGFNHANAAGRQKVIDVLSKQAHANTKARKALETIKGGGIKLDVARLGAQGIKGGDYLALALLEGVEEVNIQWQKKEGERVAARAAGELTPEEEAKSFFGRLGEHIHDRHTWDSFFWGSLGGLTFGSLMRVGQSVLNKTDKNSLQNRSDAWARSMEDNVIPSMYMAAEGAIEGNTKKYNESVEDLILGLGLEAAINQTIGLDIEFAEIVSRATKEQLEAAEFGEAAAENARMALPLLQEIQNTYNKYANRTYNTTNDGILATQLTALDYKIGRYRSYRTRDRQEIDQYIKESVSISEEVSDLGKRGSYLSAKKEAVETDLKDLQSVLKAVKSEQKQGKAEGIPIIEDAIKHQEEVLKEIDKEISNIEQEINNLPEDQKSHDIKYYKTTDPGLVDLYTDLTRTERTLEYFQEDYNNLLNRDEQQKYVENAMETEQKMRQRSSVFNRLEELKVPAAMRNLVDEVLIQEQTPDGKMAAFRGDFEITATKDDGSTETVPIAMTNVTQEGDIIGKLIIDGKQTKRSIKLNKDGTISHQHPFKKWSNPKVLRSAESVRNKQLNRLFEKAYSSIINLFNKNINHKKNVIEQQTNLYNFISDKISKAFNNTSKRTRIPLSDETSANAIKKALKLDEQDTQDKAHLVLSIEQLQIVKDHVADSIEQFKAEISNVQERLNDLLEDIKEADLFQFEEINKTMQEYVNEAEKELEHFVELDRSLDTYIKRLTSYIKGLNTRLKTLQERKDQLNEAIREIHDNKLQGEETVEGPNYEQLFKDVTQEINNLKKEKIPAAERKLRMTEEQIQQNKIDSQNIKSKIQSVTQSLNKRAILVKKFNDLLEEIYVQPTSTVLGSKTDLVKHTDVESEIDGFSNEDFYKAPMQPFDGTEHSFIRTAVNIDSHLADMEAGNDTYEPQVLFHSYINEVAETMKSRHVAGLAYNREALKRDFDNVLTDKQKKFLSEEGYEDAVFVVLAESKEGKPIYTDSLLNKDKEGKPVKTIMYAPINGVKRDSKGNPVNERFASEFPLVDLKDYSFDSFVTAAEKYQEKVINPVLESSSPILFDIVEITPGVINRPVTKAVHKTTAAESLVAGNENLKHVKVKIAWKDELTLKSGTTVSVNKGHVYFEHKGALIRAHRVKLQESDVERVEGLVQLALTKDTPDAAADILKEINETAYMLYSKKDALEKDSNYTFYLSSERIQGKQVITGVHAGGKFYTKEQLLNSAENTESIESFREFLRTKYYNVTQKNLTPFNKPGTARSDYTVKRAKLIKEGDNIIDGELEIEKTYLAKDGGYLSYLLHSDSPKLLVPLDVLPTDRVDKVYNPQTINRSARFMPRTLANEVLPGDFWNISKDEREAQSEERSKTPKTPTKFPITDEFTEAIKGLESIDEINSAVQTLFNSLPDSVEPVVRKITKRHSFLLSTKNTGIYKNVIIPYMKDLETEGVFESLHETPETAKPIVTEDTDITTEESFMPATPEEKRTPPDDNPINKDVDHYFDRIDTGEPGTMQDRREGLEAFRKILPDVTINIVERNTLEEGVDARINIARDNASVLVARTAALMAETHEAWHGVTQLFMTPEERASLYNETRKVLGNTRVTIHRTKEVVRGKDLTDVQTEEFLAEEFRSFMLVGRDNYIFGKDQTVKRNIFQRIWDTIVDLLLGKGFHKDFWLRQDPSRLINKFEEVSQREYRLADRVNRSEIVLDRIGDKTEADSRHLVNAFNNLFFIVLDGAYEHAYDNLTISTINNIYADAQKIVDSRKTQKPIFKEFAENWDALKEAHVKFLEQYNIQMDLETLLEPDEMLNRDNRDMIPSNRISAINTMPNAVKLLIAGIPRTKVAGQSSDTIAFSKVIGLLYKELSNIHNPKEIVHKIEELAHRNKEIDFAKLKQRLGIESAENITPVGLSKERALLQAKFFNHFHKSNNHYYTTVISEEGHIYNVNANETTLQSQIIDRWKNNIKLGIENNIAAQPVDFMRLYPEKFTTEKTAKEYKAIYDAGFKRIFSNLFKPKKGKHVLDINHELPIGVDAKGNRITRTIGNITVGAIDKYSISTPMQTEMYVTILNALGINIAPRTQYHSQLRESLSSILNVINNTIKEAKLLKKDIFIEDIFNSEKIHINKEIKELANIQIKQTNHFIDNQIQTQRGSTEYSIMEKTRLAKLIDEFNTGTVPYYLIPYNETTGEGSLATIESQWVSYIQERGKENPNAVGKTIIRNLGREIGDKTDMNRLTPTDYQVSYVNNVLTGNFPFMRAAERGLEYGIQFGLGYMRNNPISEEMFLDQLKKYLKGEIAIALAFRQHDNFKHLVKSSENNGLSYFKHALPELDKDIHTLEKFSNVSPDKWVSTANQIIRRRYKYINDELAKLIRSERTKTANKWLNDELLIIQDGKYTVDGISTESLKRILNVRNNILTKDQFNQLVDYFNYYHLSSFIEQTKLIVGDPLIYRKESGMSDLFKRTSTFVSTISGMINHPGYITYLNEHYKRLDNMEHSENYTDFVFKDVKVDSEYYSIYEAVLGKEKAAPYKQMAENDAAGWALLDGYRSFYLRSALWNDRFEKTWQYQAQFLGRYMVKKGRINAEHFKDVFGEHIPDNKLDTAHLEDKAYYQGELITPTHLKPLPISKPQGTGPIRNVEVEVLNRPQITKTALSPLLPTDFVHSEEMMEFIMDATLNGVDFIFPESAKKGDILGNTKGELSSLYKEDGSMNKIGDLIEHEGYLIEEINWNDIGNQLEMHPEGKPKVTRSSQERRLRWVDIFHDGKIRKGFEHLGDLHQENVKLERLLIEKHLNQLVDNLGYKLKEGTESDYVLANKEKFRDSLIREFRKRTMPENVTEGIDMVITAHKAAYFDTLPTKRQIVNVLQGMLRANAINIKTAGDMLTQESVTGYEISRATRVQKSGTLKPYQLIDKDGNVITEAKDVNKAVSVSPMEVMISLPVGWTEFIRKYKGFEGTFEQRLDQFNTKINDPSWEHYDNFNELRHLAASRIPGEHRNSMETARVVKYLSPHGGPRVVLPSEIVAKTSSDFDIDKLPTYFRNYTKEEKTGLPVYIKYNDQDPSIRQIENRLVEIMTQVVLDVNNFKSLITPNDPGIIKSQANKIMPEKILDNHDLLSYSNNIDVAQNYWQANTLVGISAVHNVSHSLSQESPIRVGSRLVRLFFSDHINVNPMNNFMGHHLDSDGNEISRNIGNILTGAVDATKEDIPSIKRINLTTSTINTYMLLNRLAGDTTSPVGMITLSEFFTHPAIIAFENRRSVKRSVLHSNKYGIPEETLKESVIKVLADAGVEQFQGVKDSEYTFLYETFNDYMKLDHRRMTEEDLKGAQQTVIDHLDRIEKTFGHITTMDKMKNRPLAVMEFYMYYREVGKVLSTLQNLLRPDASMTKDRVTTFVRQKRLEKLKSSQIFDAESIDNLFNNTFVGAFQNVHDTSIPLFKKHFFTEDLFTVDHLIWGKNGLYDHIDNPALARLEDDVVKAIHKIQNGLVTHILHTTIHNGTKINSRYKELAMGRNSVPMKFSKIKNIAGDNIFLEEITPIINEYNRRRDSNSEIHYLKTHNRTYNVQESNDITNALRELLDHSNEEVRQFAADLLEFSIIQSGTQTSYTSFFELLPAEYYQPLASNILHNYTAHSKPITKGTVQDVFANLAYDPVVVPRYSSRYLYKQLTNGDTKLKVNVKNPKSLYPYLVVEKNILPLNESRELRRQGIKPPKERLLFEKVPNKFEGNSQIYKRIPIKGEPLIFQEHTGVSDAPSILPYNNIVPKHRQEVIPPDIAPPMDDSYYRKGLQYQEKAVTNVKPNKELNRVVDRFLTSIDVTTEKVVQVKDRMGKVVGDTEKGVVAVADMVNKTVQVIENRADITSLPEEAAHFYVDLLPNTHPLKRKMLNNIKKYDVYNEVVNDYSELYNNDETLLKTEAVGKLIAREIINNHDYKMNNAQKTEINNWWRALWNFIKNLFNFDTSYKRAAYDIMSNNLKDLIVKDAQETAQDQMFYTPSRREVLDDVYQASLQQQKREARQKQYQEQMKKNLFGESSRKVKQENQAELTKTDEGKEITSIDRAKSEIFTNFEKYFPNYDYMATQERISFIESMTDGEISIYC